MRAGGIGRVVASKSSKFSKGDHVDTLTGWQEWVVADAARAEKIVSVRLLISAKRY